MIESAESEIKQPISVGQEFMEWAEKYWKLEDLLTITNPDKFAGEVCDYKYMRKIFIEKINGILADRLQFDIQSQHQ